MKGLHKYGVGIIAGMLVSAALVYAAGVTTFTAYTGQKISDDVLGIVDVDDTTQAASGTSKKITVNQLMAAIITSKSTATTLTDDEMNGVVLVSAAVTTTLPAVELGQTVCFFSSGANTIVVDSNASDRIILDGTALDDGDTIENTSAAAGDFICIFGDSTAGWTTLGYSGTWADGGAT